MRLWLIVAAIGTASGGFAPPEAGTVSPEPSEASYVVADISSGRVLDARWEDPARTLPMGSLIKPFTALAYAEAHGFAYPTFQCRGSGDGCWLPAGHGQVTIVSAIAGSCNAYFHQLSQHTSAERLTSTLRGFGMAAPGGELTPAALVGFGDGLRLTPAGMVRGYRELVLRATQPGVPPLLEGMIASGRTGTGKAVGAALGRAGAFVKTGTAPCLHASRADGDGYTVAMYPVDGPRLVVLVQLHGRPGAESAVAAGEILRRAAEVR